MVARAPQTGQKLIVWGESKVLVMEPPYNRFVLDYSRKVFFSEYEASEKCCKNWLLKLPSYYYAISNFPQKFRHTTP